MKSSRFYWIYLIFRIIFPINFSMVSVSPNAKSWKESLAVVFLWFSVEIRWMWKQNAKKEVKWGYTLFHAQQTKWINLKLFCIFEVSYIEFDNYIKCFIISSDRNGYESWLNTVVECSNFLGNQGRLCKKSVRVEKTLEDLKIDLARGSVYSYSLCRGQYEVWWAKLHISWFDAGSTLGEVYDTNQNQFSATPSIIS